MASTERIESAGFTLTELLVVIAILAILAGLMFPVLMRSKRAANGSACASNLGNIGKAVQLYLIDSDDAYPPVVEPFLVPFFLGTRDGGHAAASVDLNTAVRSYMPSRPIYRCPLDMGMRYADFLQFESIQLPSSFEETGSSYWYNEQLYFSDSTSTSVAYPSGAALVNDRCGVWHGQVREGDPTLIRDPQQLYRGYRYTTEFTDGHVRILTPSQLNSAKGAVYGSDWILNGRYP